MILLLLSPFSESKVKKVPFSWGKKNKHWFPIKSVFYYKSYFQLWSDNVVILCHRKQFPSTPSISKIPSWQIPLKGPSASNSQSVNHSSSDISPVSIESSNSSPVNDGCLSPPDSLGAALGVNGDVAGLAAALPSGLQDQVRTEVRGDEEENDGASREKADGGSMQTEDRQGGEGEMRKKEDKLRRPEDAGNESQVD